MDAIATKPNVSQDVEKLDKITNFRLQMLLAQVKSDMLQGVTRKDGSRKKASVDSISRVILSALSHISNGAVTSKPPIDEAEKRAVSTMVEAFNGLMLKVALDEAKKQAKQEGETNGDKQNTSK
jgi:hypothetical protein